MLKTISLQRTRQLGGKRFRGYPAIAALLLALTTPGLAAPNVVASIKPLHSLVASVMGETGVPHLLLPGASSPHSYSLRPSDASALQNADLVFWIGPDLELFMEQALQTLSGDAGIIALSEAVGLTLMPLREGGNFEAHEDEGHDDDGHEEEHAEADPHIWLDPQNAMVMVGAIAEALEQADPANAATYASNASSTLRELSALRDEIANTLDPFTGVPFVVFHDGYRYFEESFGLAAAGSITVSPESLPGARRISEIRERITELGAVCVFAEPQFESSLVGVAIEGTGAKSGVLDPLGAELEDGPDLYFELLRGMASSFVDCFD